MAGIADFFAPVTVPRAEYEELTRKSERIDAVERYINGSKYPCMDDIKAILCIEKKEEKKAGEEDGN